MKKLIALLCVLALATGCSNTNANDSITVYTRDSSSGTREAFAKAGDFEKTMTDAAVEVSSNGDMATKVGQEKNAIGYVSLSTDFEKNNIRALEYEGVAPSEESVLDGTYKLQRPFSYVTRATDDFESKDKEQLVKAFLVFMEQSKEGMEAVEAAGGVVDLEKAKPWSELATEFEDVLSKDNSGITIRTTGSTSVEKTVKAAFEMFSPMAGNVQFTMNQTGSGAAVPSVLGSEKDGVNAGDIGFASREFKEEDGDISNAMMQGQYCVDAVVTVVNKDNTAVTNITQQQIHDIYTGAVKNWSEVK